MYCRMWRKIALLFVSLASVCITTIVVHGFFSHDSINIGTGTREVGAAVLRGHLRFDYRIPGNTTGIVWSSQPVSSYRLRDEFSSVYLGFGAEYQQVTQRGAVPIQVYKLLLPVWIVVFVPISLWVFLIMRCCGNQHGVGSQSQSGSI